LVYSLAVTLTKFARMPHAVSFWEKDTWLQPADVLILGGGLLGLWMAIQYKQQQPAKRVILIDHAPIPTGASTRNAGFACFGSPSEMLYDAQLNGADAMLQVVEMRYKGIQHLRSRLGDERIGLELCGGFECYTEWPDDFDDKLHELNGWLAPIMGTPQAFAPCTNTCTACSCKVLLAWLATCWKGRSTVANWYKPCYNWRKKKAFNVCMACSIRVGNPGSTTCWKQPLAACRFINW